MKGSVENLSQYVSRVMNEKRLGFEDVSRMSGNAITEGYVRSITRGAASNPSVKKLQALAAGLGVEEEEIFRVARGLPADLRQSNGDMSSSSYHTILALMSECWKNRALNELLQEVTRLTPASLERALKMIRVLNAHQAASDRDHKTK
ncbi:MAG: helix-turn-helix domain-containing protein [Acidobacteriota bacterium]